MAVINIKDFMQETVGEEKEVKLDRFATPFVIKALSEKENDVLKKTSTKTYRNKSGNIQRDLDTDKYGDALLARCVVTPDLQNAELQEYYGTEGDSAETLKAMLLAGEYATLTQEVLELNGFNENEEDFEDDVKN